MLKNKVAAIALSTITLTFPIIVPVISSPTVHAAQIREAKKITKTEMNIGDTIELKNAKTTSKIVVVEDGKLTAKAPGYAIINYTNEDGQSDRMIIYVRPALRVFKEEITLRVNQKIRGIVNYRNATLTSSDAEIVSVDKDILTAKKAGTATITAEYEGMKAELKITVKDDDFTVDKNKEISPNESFQLTVIPEGKYTYKSSNPRVATVDENGKVTGIKAGIATVITISESGQRKITTIKVKAVPTSISVPKEITVYENSKIYLPARVNPYNADQTLTYTSSDDTIAEIKNSIITGKKKGETIITITASNGIKAETKVTVKSARPNFEKDIIRIKEGETETVKATNATKYISSNPNIATVDENGVVTAKSFGTTTIWAENEDGVRVGCIVSVTSETFYKNFYKNFFRR